MEWTERQRQILETDNKSMLIAAAAGSGKTTVLVEKIKRLIIEKGVDVKNLLVVTFTRAAAAEMKEKIIRAINEAAQEKPEKASYLRKQLDGIASANISTFDSFAKDIVKKYFYIIDLDPDLRTADESESRILKAEAMDELFDKLYEEADTEIISFFIAYGDAKSDRTMKAELSALYDKLRNLPEGLGWLEKAIAKDPSEFVLDYMKSSEERAERELKEAVRCFERVVNILKEKGLEKAAEKTEKDLEAANAIAAAEGEEQKQLLSEFKAQQLKYSAEENEIAESDGTKNRVKVIRDRGKELLKSVGAQGMRDTSQMITVIEQTLPYQKTILTILKRFEEIRSEERQNQEMHWWYQTYIRQIASSVHYHT